MSFLQPWLLLGLPLIALPVIIHLINQRRFQTVQWAAMMFLLAAHRMARGYSRLRQWLIMLFRMLAIAGLLFAASRPLASGWLGLAAGGQADTTIILLDRSPSMQERSAGSGESKLNTGRQQLVQTLETLGSSRWVLIESTQREPREIEAPGALLNLADAGPSSAPADLPLMLQAAYDYLQANRSGRTEIWICSDLRDNDWGAESGRWSALRDAFLELPQGVRFHLLAYPQTSAGNTGIRVTEVRRETTLEGADLLVSLRLSRPGAADTDKVAIPVQFEIEGARSVANFELNGSLAEIKEHRIPLERTRERGWGRVSIPADANPADDEFYFAFDTPPPRRTVLVTDDPQVVRPLELAASIAPERGLECTVETATTEQLTAVEWDQIALLLWHGPLPTGDAAELVQTFVERGGQAVFLPPQNGGSESFLGVQWQSWRAETEPVPVENWRSDSDVLARTLSGAALPLGQLQIRQYCGLEGEFTPLATLKGGAPLVARVPTKRGGVYFWTTTPAPRDSSLATEGVVLYAFVQRALAAGAEVIGKTRQLDAGTPPDGDPASWNRLTGDADSLSTEAASQAGVYSAGERLLAVNRPLAEDDGNVLADARVGELFRGLDYSRVDAKAGDAGALIQEIWRIFLMSMLIALLVEAVLCLPKPARAAGAAA